MIRARFKTAPKGSVPAKLASTSWAIEICALELRVLEVETAEVE